MIVMFVFFFNQALALLSEYIDKEDSSIRIGAIMGLGIAYAGAQNEQVCIFWHWQSCLSSFFPCNFPKIVDGLYLILTEAY